MRSLPQQVQEDLAGSFHDFDKALIGVLESLRSGTLRDAQTEMRLVADLLEIQEQVKSPEKSPRSKAGAGTIALKGKGADLEALLVEMYAKFEMQVNIVETIKEYAETYMGNGEQAFRKVEALLDEELSPNQRRTMNYTWPGQGLTRRAVQERLRQHTTELGTEGSLGDKVPRVYVDTETATSVLRQLARMSL